MARKPGWIVCCETWAETSPAFAFRDRDCLFALTPNWRLGALMWFLFWRLLRLRDDAIFFHASAMGIEGSGTMFIATVRAVASRPPHCPLPRAVTCCSAMRWRDTLPATGKLVPFRRPVGNKARPALRRRQSRACGPSTMHASAKKGFVRFDVNTLFSVAVDPQPVALENRRLSCAGLAIPAGVCNADNARTWRNCRACSR